MKNEKRKWDEKLLSVSDNSEINTLWVLEWYIDQENVLMWPFR